jgi:hypothetical protein
MDFARVFLSGSLLTAVLILASIAIYQNYGVVLQCVAVEVINEKH